jgi:hypothetical protein
MIITNHTLPPDEAAEEEARERCPNCGSHEGFQVGYVRGENSERRLEVLCFGCDADIGEPDQENPQVVA